jgi:flagellar hook assembly protein FlgD
VRLTLHTRGVPGSRCALQPNRPNPFNASTVIGYRVALPGRVSLTIHDVAGRQVRRLLDAHRAAGAYEITWDGRADSGRAVASGLYVGRLRTPAGEAVRKLMLVR